VQLPADPHDTELISADLPRLRAGMPATFPARPHLPRTWLTTNALKWQPT
jgi:hypothetical protein